MDIPSPQNAPIRTDATRRSAEIVALQNQARREPALAKQKRREVLKLAASAFAVFWGIFSLRVARNLESSCSATKTKTLSTSALISTAVGGLSFLYQLLRKSDTPRENEQELNTNRLNDLEQQIQIESPDVTNTRITACRRHLAHLQSLTKQKVASREKFCFGASLILFSQLVIITAAEFTKDCPHKIINPLYATGIAACFLGAFVLGHQSYHEIFQTQREEEAVEV